jgi:predicted nucleic acid-binding protein
LADCLHLAAGKAMNATVVTADQKFFDRGGLAWSQIRLLSDESSN